MANLKNSIKENEALCSLRLNLNNSTRTDAENIINKKYCEAIRALKSKADKQILCLSVMISLRTIKRLTTKKQK
ncbi:hypothetical protein CMT89_05795 [Elizabethkingia anophelis]|nr:hypothetical protein AL491_14980 [Elizabethkingia anophelis]MDV3900700.1 hypothetical protein [Elizabethkingia anophelis]MDV4057018.1 hypothetical protein [Elizabethkingia anophelis]